MNTDRLRQLKTLFDRAMQLDAAGREEFVARECGSDTELRRDLEALLAEHALTFRAQAAATPSATAVAPAPAPSGSGTTTSASPVLADRYEVLQELGRGGMSVVYLAQDRQLLSRRVVVKVLLDTIQQDPWVRQKFQQEMEALARINHPGVVGVLDTGLTPDGSQFLVMQFVEGATLRKAIEPGGMNPSRVAGIVRQIGSALAAAHDKGVWHRDLKPENIMLEQIGTEEHVKLIDFGIAGIQNSQFTTEKTQVAGSLSYMAPEQLTQQSCAASDTYALAVVSYEMLTGTLPSNTAVKPNLPDSVMRVIQKGMGYPPDTRHATAKDFAEELSFALTGGQTERRYAPTQGVEIAHVLFTDLVGYSQLRMDQQKDYLAQLQQVVRESERYRTAESAGEIINLPTGDGMALAFFGDPTAPAQCALEVARSLKSKPHLLLRMGINSGPVFRVADMNANQNVAGGGINMAQRVMDCADPGQILVSKTLADVLTQLGEWAPFLHELGECSVKHGVKIHLWTLATGELGVRDMPAKLKAQMPEPAKPPSSKKWLVLAAMAVFVLLGAYIMYAYTGWFAKTPPAAAVAQSELKYHVIVQRYRDGKPYQEPFRLSGERVFEAGYAVQLVVSSRDDGYMYVINEGPKSTAEKPDLTALFPLTTMNAGSAALKANVEQQIPRDGAFVFDEEKGVEKLWVVWSQTPVPELESSKKWNPQDQGVFNDNSQAIQISSFLKKLGEAKVEMKRDDANKSTVLNSTGKTFAYVIPLDHQ